ncbi:MAG TPA: hypothetical protein VLQ66_03255 [Paenisporosarcina sp.]|nr:hypothetical protein [Paenisporosarcina sp.]
MNWMYFGVSIIILIGIIVIIEGFKLTKIKHEKKEYIEGNAGYNAGVVETLVLFLLSLLFKYVPFWIMRVVLILFGLVIIIFGMFILSSG